MVGHMEFLFPPPLILNWVEFGAQEVCHFFHLPKDIGQVMGNFLMEDWQVGSKIGLPYMLD